MIPNPRRLAIAAVLVGLVGGHAAGQCDPIRTHKLLAADGEFEDSFGGSVAVMNGIALVGTSRDDDNGSNSGSVYVYEVATGQEITKILPIDGQAGDRFGISVSFSTAAGSSLAVIGAYLDDDVAFQAGTAYIFDLTDATNPTQVAKLLAADGAVEDLFGVSVALGGSVGNEIAIVGAYADDDHGSISGSAYLFDASTGEQLFKLVPNDSAEGDSFGWSVGISGNIAIVGAFADDDHGDRSGAVYFFDTATGQQLAKLVPEDGAALDFFGYSVAIGGSGEHPVAIVGAYLDDDNGTDSGSVYVFDISDPANPVEQHKFLPEGDGSQDWFGYELAMNGAPGDDVVLVSALSDFQIEPFFRGSIYLFDTVSGEQLARFNLDDQTTGDFFGWSVALNGNSVVCGAPSDDENGSHSGSAHVFDLRCPTDVTPADLVACSVTFGSTDNDPCDVANLLEDDDIDQVLRSQFGFSAFERNLTEIVINGNGADATTMASINTRDGSDTTNVVAKVKARNYTTNSIDDIAQYDVSFPSDDTSHSTPVNSTDFVDANGDIEVRIRYVAPATFTPLGFTVGLDQIEVLVE